MQIRNATRDDLVAIMDIYSTAREIMRSTDNPTQWKDDDTYGTIHRLAGDGSAKGIATLCNEFCKKRINNIRLDTHQNNKAMQHLLKKNGFHECGIIYVADGSPRVAYQYRR